jgi:hypothetical protein
VKKPGRWNGSAPKVAHLAGIVLRDDDCGTPAISEDYPQYLANQLAQSARDF